MTGIDRHAVDEALDRVVDPCSNALGVPLGLREMGLTRSVDIDDASGTVTVTMRLTSPCCEYGPTMALAAEQELAAVPGVRSATVTIDYGAAWTPAEIMPNASVRLAGRRSHTIAVFDVHPHEWSTWKSTESLQGSDPLLTSRLDSTGGLS